MLLIALVPGRGAAANDPDDLDDIALPPPPPPPPPPPRAAVPAPVEVAEPGNAGGGLEDAVVGQAERGNDDNNRGDLANALGDIANVVGDGDDPVGERREATEADAGNDAESDGSGGCDSEGAVAVPADDDRDDRRLDGQGVGDDEDGEAGAAAEGRAGVDVIAGDEGAVGEGGGGAAVVAPPEERAVGEEDGGRADFGGDVGARVLPGEGGGVDEDDIGAGPAAAEENRADVAADEGDVGAGAGGEEEGRGRGRAPCLAEAARVSAAGSLVCVALAVLPAVVVLLPLLTGEIFGSLSPLVRGMWLTPAVHRSRSADTESFIVLTQLPLLCSEQ